MFLNYTNILCLTLFDMYIQNYVLLWKMYHVQQISAF